MINLTDEDKRNILFLYKSHTIKEISILTGFSTFIISKVIHDSGIKTKVGRRKIDSQKIIADFDKGFTDISFLSKKYNCHEFTIRKLLKGRDIPKKKRRKREPIEPKGKAKDILSALEKIPNLSIVAKQFNVSRQYVFNLKEKYKENNNE